MNNAVTNNHSLPSNDSDMNRAIGFWLTVPVRVAVVAFAQAQMTGVRPGFWESVMPDLRGAIEQGLPNDELERIVDDAISRGVIFVDDLSDGTWSVRLYEDSWPIEHGPSKI